MKVKELRALLSNVLMGSFCIPDDAEVLTQVPDAWEDEGVTAYKSAGTEYDREKNELIINIE